MRTAQCALYALDTAEWRFDNLGRNASAIRVAVDYSRDFQASPGAAPEGPCLRADQDIGLSVDPSIPTCGRRALLQT